MIKEIDINDIKEMIKKNEDDKKFCQQITKETQEKGFAESMKDEFFLKRIIAETRHSSGMVIMYPHGNIIMQGKNSYYYRGENALYGSSKPSIHRNVPKNPLEKLIHYFVAEMRIYEFYKLISLFKITKQWPGDILYRAVAQHYGIPTNLLDITTDLEVALFFACCKYDKNINAYRPLNKSDFKEEKDKYGVLFKADSFLADLTLHPSNIKNNILPIGFQPFMRCHKQYGYMYEMNEDNDLYKDDTFNIMKFRHSIDLSEKIFNHMDGGEKIFPREGLSYLSKEIDNIKTLQNFYVETFNHVYNTLKPNISNVKLKKELFKRNIKISNSPVKIDYEKINKINKKYEKIDFLKEYGASIHSKKVFVDDDYFYIPLF